MALKTNKILLIRFSSFGDVVQSLSIATRLQELGTVHWVTRSEFTPIIENHPGIEKVWSLNKQDGLLGLFKLAQKLQKEGFTHVYDAHNNLRSHLICFLLKFNFQNKSSPIFLCKSQFRLKRFLLFSFRINLYQMPFSGQRDLLLPLKKWGLSSELPPTPQIFPTEIAILEIKKRLKSLNLNEYIVLAPSAAFELKRWPIEHWKKLINLQPEKNFIILGGKEDSFLKQLEGTSKNVFNWSGQTSLIETVAVVSLAQALVSNDTGVLHVGEQLGIKTIALMGPAPFGFPSRATTKILEIDLKCRPCSKHGQGPCVNPEKQKCLVDIRPDFVSLQLNQILTGAIQ
jgi:ADP-heptose:LPS heptosyltransferase